MLFLWVTEINKLHGVVKAISFSHFFLLFSKRYTLFELLYIRFILVLNICLSQQPVFALVMTPLDKSLGKLPFHFLLEELLYYVYFIKKF